MGEQQANPYLIDRENVEQVLESKGLTSGKIFENRHGRAQQWHIKGGPTFGLQWRGTDGMYVDQDQVSFIYNGVSDWLANNPNGVH